MRSLAVFGLGVCLAVAGNACQQSPGAAPKRSATGVVADLAAFGSLPVHVTADVQLTRVSQGYRAVGARLDATLPASSRAPLRIGNVEIDASLTNDVTAEVVHGSLVFRDAERDTDVVLVSDRTRVEEIRILRTPHAPTHARYRVRGEQVRVRDGRIEVLDHAGRYVLGTEPMYAVDARGVHRDLTVTQIDGTIDVDLDTAGLTFPIAMDPVWTAAPSMKVARRVPAIAKLPSGKLLVAGGLAGSGPIAAAEIYDFAARTWTSASAMTHPRAFTAAHLLGTGNVLIAGGSAAAGQTTELYSEGNDKWVFGASMNTLRADFTSVMLASGQVMVIGGKSAGNDVASTEVYTPGSNTWKTVGSMRDARVMPAAVTLNSGKVLVAGGEGSEVLSSAELYDPASETWTVVASMALARQGHAMTLLPDGRVLVAGGFDGESGSFVGFDSAEIYDPLTDKWTSTPTMKAKRVIPGLAVLPSGRVLLTGSGFIAPFLSSAEVYDPVANTWSVAGTLTVSRGTHFAYANPGGTVLIGAGFDGTNFLSSTEEYTPLAIASVCTGNGECASGVCADGVCCNRVCDGVCEACDVAASKGTCTAVTGAPHGTRPACGDGAGDPCKAETCGGTDGTRCIFTPAGVQSCGSATCVAGVETHAAKCDGAGACGDVPKPCGAFKCGASACLTTCSTDAECTMGSFCNAGTCVTKVGLGEPCAGATACSSGLFCTDGVCCAVASCGAGSACNAGVTKGACAKIPGATCGSPDECGSGFCVDGYCCDSACNGQCEACDVADATGAFGKCTAVTEKPHGSRVACPSDTANACSSSSCDGETRTSCKRFVGATVACRPQSCVDGTLTAPATCNGTGSCPTAVTSTCGGFACAADGKACKTSCTASTDCVGTNVCLGGLCRPRAGTCSGDGLSLIPGDGSAPQLCAPYLCVNDACPTTCETSAECSSGNLCNPDTKTCAAGAATAEDGGGCVLGSPAGGTSRTALLFAFALTLAALRGRRRTA